MENLPTDQESTRIEFAVTMCDSRVTLDSVPDRCRAPLGRTCDGPGATRSTGLDFDLSDRVPLAAVEDVRVTISVDSAGNEDPEPANNNVDATRSRACWAALLESMLALPDVGCSAEPPAPTSCV